MKKILLLMISITLIAVICFGCDSSKPNDSTTSELGSFSVGYGVADISPQKSVYLRGYNDPVEERMSTGVSDRLYATCVALTDEEGETIIFISTDLLMLNVNPANEIREAITEATDVPSDHIIIHATHNHSAPDTTDQSYYQFLKTRCIESAKDALADRKPAEMYTTFIRPEETVNFVRHYLLQDGSYMGENLGSIPKDQLVGHTGIADNLLQLIKFTRDGGKDVILMNWQSHPKGTAPYSHTTATCNYAGIMRKTVEESLDCHGLFVLSGCGNLNANSQILEENTYENYPELVQMLGQLAVKATENLQQANTGNIYLAENIFTKDSHTFGNDSQIPLYAFSFGDVAFATAPFEIFDTNAVAVRENSKFKMTFYASCSNGYLGYLPTPPSWDWEQHYEVRITYYPKGTAEEVEGQLLEMLDQLFADSGNTETEKEPGYLTPEFVPYSDGVDYMILDAGMPSAYTAVKNGYYKIVVVNGTTIKPMLVLNEEVAAKVTSQANAKFLFNESNVIVGLAE